MRSLFLTSLLYLLTQVATAKPLFPTSPLLEKKVGFWERIFGEYNSQQVVVHDRDRPFLIFDVIDVTELGFENNLSPGVRDTIDEKMSEFDQIILDFKEQGETAKSLSPRHRKIWNLYQKEERGTAILQSGSVVLRSQGGLADTFKKATATARIYIPKMEKIFKDHGLPPELTRLPYVESMFNTKARSKVGASGMWQLMPSAARPYIKVNRKVDQRNSPLLATQAAAKILRRNYAELGDWSLAITAYNHGLGGVKRAVAKTGSRHLHDIVLEYESPSFGFASSNFYAEFLAALRTHSKLTHSKIRPNIIADTYKP
jgi:membrane-bound lytic murein transglycosylase D